MSSPTIFETCRPRGDILRGAVADADFAADLASVVSGSGSPAYVDPARFFANTYPTRGLRNLEVAPVSWTASTSRNRSLSGSKTRIESISRARKEG